MSASLRCRVLIVDDDPEYRTMVQLYLRKIGCACTLAADAGEALDILGEKDFDLVVSDIRMKGMDGLQLMREALRLYPQLRFIIMTGHAADYSFSDIVDAGATDFISKPFSITELKAKLERVQREVAILLELGVKNAALAREAEINASFAELSRALLSPLSFEIISDLVLNCALRLTDSPIGFAGYIDRQNGTLVCPTMSGEVWRHCRMSDRNSVFKEFKGLWGWVLENLAPVLSNAPQEDSRASGVPAGHVPIQRFLSAPALAENQLIGLVAVANSRRDYAEEDLTMLSRLTDIYALATHRKWADENLRQTEEQLRKTSEELQRLVEERSEKLSRAGQAIMRSIDRFREIAQE